MKPPSGETGQDMDDVVVYFNKLMRRWLWYRESEPDKTSGNFATEAEALSDARSKLPASPEKGSELK